MTEKCDIRTIRAGLLPFLLRDVAPSVGIAAAVFAFLATFVQVAFLLGRLALQHGENKILGLNWWVFDNSARNVEEALKSGFALLIVLIVLVALAALFVWEAVEKVCQRGREELNRQADGAESQEAGAA